MCERKWSWRYAAAPIAALLLSVGPAVAAPAVTIAIDPPAAADGEAFGHDGACRSGTLSLGAESMPLALCLQAVEGKSLDLLFSLPALQWSHRTSLLDNPELAVAYLSDRRFQDFWPTLIRFGGEDGGKLIEAALKYRAARAAVTPRGPQSRSTLLSSLSKATRAAVAEAQTLSDWGLTAEALARLDRAVPQPDRKGRYNERKSYEWLAIMLARANAQHSAGRIEDALQTYRQAEENGAIPQGFRINATVNRAALLAETGRGQAALDLIVPTMQWYAEQSGEGQVEGSMRQFAWIRSCALQQIGREAEAQQMSAGLFDAPPPLSRDFFVPSGESLENRYRRCIGDVNWLSGAILDDSARPLPPTGIIVLRYGGDMPTERLQSLWKLVRMRPGVADAADYLREPPSGWRDLLDRDKRAARVRAIRYASSP